MSQIPSLATKHKNYYFWNETSGYSDLSFDSDGGDSDDGISLDFALQLAEIQGQSDVLGLV